MNWRRESFGTWMMLMTEYTALVTGGTRGIGAAIAQRLEADGWQVLTPARSALELASQESVTQYLQDLGDTRIDGLVLNAGINTPAHIDDMPVEQWQHIQSVNLTSSFMLVGALTPGMARRGFGRLVAISSVYASRNRAGRAAYSASKAGLASLMASVAVEFAGSGILANTVAPGFVDTEMTHQNNDAATIAKLLERVPVGRLASTSEIADAVAFLISPSNTYITGQELAVDGGFTCT